MQVKKDMTDHKIKTFEFEVKSLTKDAGSDDCFIEGYANTVSKDRVGDVVIPSAFEKSLPTYMTNSILLENHEWSKPAGSVLTTEITENGLFIKARISDARPDLKMMVREGTLKTFSIGYNELVADYDESTKTKYIKELELLEISIVTVPANAEALFSVVKQAKSASDLKNYIETVKSCVDYELTINQVLAISEHFLNSNEETMTKKELMEALQKKSTPVVAAPVVAKADEQAPSPAPDQAADQGQASDPVAEIMAKLDAIAQALASVMEAMKPEAAEESSEAASEEEKPSDAAPAADDAAKAEKPAEDDKEEEMSDDDIEKQLEQIDSMLGDL